MDTNLFGARLFEMREAAGLTLRQLAAILGVDHTYLSHLEGGRRTPSDELIERISAHFGENPDVLRLQAGQIPKRLIPVVQRNPQLTLSLLGSLEPRPQEASGRWYADVVDIVGGRTSGQISLPITDSPYAREPFARHIDAGKNTPVYNAHSYHTKVPFQGIVPYIEHYTSPGDLVLDPFCGSGMTGVAAILSGRHAVLNDLSPAAVHIARNYVTPCNPGALGEAFARLLEDMNALQADLYGTQCTACGGAALIEYSILSDVLSCGECGSGISVWDNGRDASGRLVPQVECPACRTRQDRNALQWLRSEPCLLSTTCLAGCAGRRSERAPLANDMKRWRSAASLPLPHWVPDTPFGPEWEMWRQGHADRGIHQVRNFFTERNLRALAALRAWITEYPNTRVGAALLFAFTGAVNRASKRYQWNQKRPTNVLSGTLYVSSLFYEFNVFRLFERKVRAAQRLFQITANARGRAAVRLGSAVEIRDIPDASVDYVFTDPPFGSNIYYADCSLLWEAWLDSFTDKASEIVINRAQKHSAGGKDLKQYQDLLTLAFKEIRRVLKPNRWASIVFHNSSADVWQAVQNACVDAGFTLGSAVMFDKRQKSFKGLRGITHGERVPNYDVVLNLEKRTPVLAETESDAASEARLVEFLREHVAVHSGQPGKCSTAYLHSLAVQRAFEERLSLRTIDLRAFERLLEREFARTATGWTPSEAEVDGDAPARSRGHSARIGRDGTDTPQPSSATGGARDSCPELTAADQIASAMCAERSV